MKCAAWLAAVALLVAAAEARPRPQKEGAFFTNEAIRQAQNTHLIPQGAVIQKVQEGIEVSARENIPGDARLDLVSILSDLNLPSEVIQNLEGQVVDIGRTR